MSRPRVIVYDMASVDGRLTIAPEVLLLHGDERWSGIVGEGHDPYQSMLERFKPEVFLEGSGSFVRDDDAPSELPSVPGDTSQLYEHFLPKQVVESAPRRGWLAVVDGQGRVRWTIKEWPDPAFAGWHLLVLTCTATPAEYLAFLRREDIPYFVAGTDRVDLLEALEHLAEHLGVTTVVATPGGRLGGALLRFGLIDELIVDVIPALVGGTTTPSLFTAPNLASDQRPTRLRLLEHRIEPHDRMRLHYEVLPPE